MKSLPIGCVPNHKRRRALEGAFQSDESEDDIQFNNFQTQTGAFEQLWNVQTSHTSSFEGSDIFKLSHSSIILPCMHESSSSSFHIFVNCSIFS